MKRYLRIYKKILQMNFSALLAYRANFVNSILSSMGWGIFSILSIILLTSRTSHIYDWSREEVLILAGAYSIFIGIFHMLFSRNFETIAYTIHLGRLDSMLVKPVDSQFLLSFLIINYTSAFRIILGLVFIVYMVVINNIQISFLNIVGFLLFMVIGLLLLYSLWFIVISLTIWYTRLTNLIDFLYTATGTARYPSEIFRELRNYLFFFLLPLTLVLNTPTKTLLGKVTLVDITELIIFSIVFFYLSRRFWKFALKFYTSASG